MTLPNGIWCWIIIPLNYNQEGVKNYKIHVKENNNVKYALLNEAANPFPYHYEPKVEKSDPLGQYMACYCLYIIDIMGWMIELGRIDIATKSYILSSHNAYPCE